MPRRSLVEHLEAFNRHTADVAYVQRRGYRTERWQYVNVAETACQFARELEARGIRKGDRVLLWGENCAEWVITFLGCMMRGVVVVPIDRAGSPDFTHRIFAEVNAKLLVISRDLMAHAQQLPTLTLEELPNFVAKHERTPLAAELDRDTTLQIVFTSGTTAEPRGVVITHGNVLANLEPFEAEVGKYLKYERPFHPIRFLNLLPLSHVFGQFLGIFIPPLLGGCVVFQESLNPAELIANIRRERISVLVAVPRLLESLKAKLERDFDSAGKSEWFREQLGLAEHEHFLKRWWRFRKIHRQFGWKFWALVSGGATLDSATEEFWRRLGYIVLQGYGLTETTSLITVNHPFHRGIGSIGKVLPKREFKLSDTGEILVRGENIARNYWQAGTLTPVTRGDGDDSWFHTGDLGELDAQGYVHFKGRQKNVIVTPEGMNVYPEDLEAALRRQPQVRDSVVFGLARNGNAEPCAVLILSDAATADSIIAKANQSLAPHQQIRHWYVWPENDFPRTATHKPRIGVIQQAAEQLRGESAAMSGGALTGTVAELVASVTGRPVGQASEADLGLSSIERVELLCAIEDRYQADLDESDLAEVKSLADLERVINREVAPAAKAQPSDSSDCTSEAAPAPSPAKPILFTSHQIDLSALASAGTRAREHHYDYPRWAQHWPITWIRTFTYYLFALPATHLIASPHVIGREHLRDLHGPALVISNHITYPDIGFILASLPPRLRHKLAVAMEGERVWALRYPAPATNAVRRVLHPIWYFLMVALFNVFPLPKLSGFRESFAYAGESADRGFSVLVFPEGFRTRTGEMSKFQSGIGMLATRLNLPVVPMRIDGLFELKKQGKRFAPPGAVTVKIGAPIHVDRNASAEDTARQLEDAVRNL